MKIYSFMIYTEYSGLPSFNIFNRKFIIACFSSKYKFVVFILLFSENQGLQIFLPGHMQSCKTLSQSVMLTSLFIDERGNK